MKIDIIKISLDSYFLALPGLERPGALAKRGLLLSVAVPGRPPPLVSYLFLPVLPDDPNFISRLLK